MGFSSLTFCLFFLPTSILIFHLTRIISKKNTNASKTILIILSILFYIWGSGRFDIYVLLFVIIFNFLCAEFYKSTQGAWILYLGIVVDVLILSFFKYPALFIKLLSSPMRDSISIIFPLGISFIIFHCISYLADQKDRELSVDLLEQNSLDHFIDFSFYILYFPKLIQGPIVPYKEMYLKGREIKPSLKDSVYGLERIIIGLSKKVLIADYFGKVLANIYEKPAIDNWTSWLVVVLFAMQLYLDFSGYSDIALGISSMFGIRLNENFNFPYLSSSITEFWRRWHISLGAWFRKYVYIPLGGNRRGNVYLNLMIVFILTGLWHGNSIRFLLWGIIHGILIVVERYIDFDRIVKKNKVLSCLGILYTDIAVWVGWLCFQPLTKSKIKQYVLNLLWINREVNLDFTWEFFFTRKTITLLLLSFGLMILFNQDFIKNLQKLFEESVWFICFKYLFLIGLLILCLISITANSFSPFLYFQY